MLLHRESEGHDQQAVWSLIRTDPSVIHYSSRGEEEGPFSAPPCVFSSTVSTPEGLRRPNGVLSPKKRLSNQCVNQDTMMLVQYSLHSSSRISSIGWVLTVKAEGADLQLVFKDIVKHQEKHSGNLQKENHALSPG